MRPWMPLLFAILGACATQNPAQGSYTGRFPAFPGEFYDALAKSCTSPAQQFARHSRSVAECREYLDPESTAVAILQYDGTTDDLPQLVVRMSARPDGAEFLLRIEAYLNVPQKSGGPVHVVFQDAALDRQITTLFELTGGTLE